ncbi:MAG TPA: S-layer homology domain-containing protein [Thermoanaerobaculia bacterium]|nr:S-layer homology domain-containing protein [Thermoanaerobaculia bacterium]
MKDGFRRLAMLLAGVTMALVFAGTAWRALAVCSGFGLPFTDLGSETTFCAEIAEAYFSGLTNGTSATTYGPAGNVPRDQMAAFITRTLDQSLLRGSRRAALNQRWNQTPHYDLAGLGATSVGTDPVLLKSDGADVWVANGDGTVSRVRASDGKNLGTWTGASKAAGVLIAMGKVFITGETDPGKLYMISPDGSPGAVTVVASTLGTNPLGITFDGDRIWTANFNTATGGSVSIVTPGTSTPWIVAPAGSGLSAPAGILFDGNNVWVTDYSAGKVVKLSSAGVILQTVTVGSGPLFPAFDGHNIWVPNSLSDSLTVVRAADGTVLKTFSAGNGDANGLSSPQAAAFDGQRILVTNNNGGLSLFKAADLTIIGNPSTPGVSAPYGVCSDGIGFWVTFIGSGKIGRF